jgi:hypothetical protein
MPNGTRNRRTPADVATENLRKARRRFNTASSRLVAAEAAHETAKQEHEAAQRAYYYVSQNPDLPTDVREEIEGSPEPTEA